MLMACSQQQPANEENNVAEDPGMANNQNAIQNDENDEEEENIMENENDQSNDEGEDKMNLENINSTYRINEQTSAVEPIGDANAKVVLLTFDDAPDQYALDIAQTLERLDANAIFFVNGHFLQTEEEQEVLKKLHDMGFVIGNHTYSHPNLNELSPEEQKEEIVRLSDLIETIIGERPAFFRPPYGITSDGVKQIVADEKMIHMNWTFGYDWQEKYFDAEALLEITLNAPELSNGANILMHDRKWTLEALEDIVIGLRDQGYEIVDPQLIEVRE